MEDTTRKPKQVQNWEKGKRAPERDSKPYLTHFFWEVYPYFTCVQVYVDHRMVEPQPKLERNVNE